MLRGQINELVQNNKKSELAPELWSILENCDVSDKNMLAQQEEEEELGSQN